MGGQPHSRLECIFRERLDPRKDVVRCPVGQLREEHGLEVSRVLGLPIPRNVVLCLSEYSWALHEPYTSLGNIAPFVRMTFIEP